MSRKDHAASWLFHIGKGFWKSVPIVGPLIDEVFYEQFKDKLKGQTERLSDEQIDLLLTAAESMPAQKIENSLYLYFEKLKSDTNASLNALADGLEEQHKQITSRLDDITGDLQPIINIKDILLLLQKSLGDENALRAVIEESERKRRVWVHRISNNQKRLLSTIPKQPTTLEALWDDAQDVIPECGEKEFRFRLHELEWLGLVERYRREGDGMWMYFLSPTTLQEITQNDS